jgi:hypothetical protein
MRADVILLPPECGREWCAYGRPILASSYVPGYASSVSPAERTREARLRRAADRQGLILQRSRRRDPRALEYGTYQLVDASTKAVVLARDTRRGFGADLDAVEKYLTGGDANHDS